MYLGQKLCDIEWPARDWSFFSETAGTSSELAWMLFNSFDFIFVFMPRDAGIVRFRRAVALFWHGSAGACWSPLIGFPGPFSRFFFRAKMTSTVLFLGVGRLGRKVRDLPLDPRRKRRDKMARAVECKAFWNNRRIQL
jgi:hypothetical protein